MLKMGTYGLVRIAMPMLPDAWRRYALAFLIVGLVGVLLIVFGTKLFDWLYKKVDFEKEILNNNLSAAAVIVAVILGLSLIVAAVIRSVIGG